MSAAGAVGRLCSSYRTSAWTSLLGSRGPLSRWSQLLLNLPYHSREAALHTSPAASAGHNKWSKVKHIKGPKDQEKARFIAKLSMMIKVAVREGGPNPDLNVQLSQLIEQCRARNIPKASIDVAIKGADKGKPFSYALFEARGPGRASLLIETLTDNSNRSLYDLRIVLNKNGGTLCDGARHCFDKKGVVTVQSHDRDGSPVQLERALELAVEAGAEDVEETQDEEEKGVYKFICDVPSMRDVRSTLASLGLLPISSALEFLPNTTVRLSDADMAQASRLLELVADLPEVIRVSDNIE